MDDRQSLLDTIQIQDAKIRQLRREPGAERERSEALRRIAWHYWKWRCLWKAAAKRVRAKSEHAV